MENLVFNINSLNLHAKGTFLEPEISGDFQIEKLSSMGFTLAGCPGSVKMAIKGIKDELELHGNIIFKNGIIYTPRGAEARLKQNKISFSGSPKAPSIEIDGGKLDFSNSDPIIYYGNYQDGKLDISVYSKSVDPKELIEAFAEVRALKDISAEIDDVDMHINGPLLEPEITSTFHIEKVSTKGFSLRNCPGTLKITVKDIMGELKLYGEAVFTSAIITGPKNTEVKLEKSKVFFSGNPKTPSLDIKGISVVEGVEIHISLKGTAESPDLNLSSNPPMPEDRLLLMLATGRSWRGAEELLGQGQVSADLAKDFLDYFVFGGSGSRIAKEYGITDISLRYDNEARGIKVKKKVTEKADLSYGVDQALIEKEPRKTTQKTGGEYKITERVSIEGEKELNNNKAKQADDKTQTDDKVLLKYKNQF